MVRVALKDYDAATAAVLQLPAEVMVNINHVHTSGANVQWGK